MEKLSIIITEDDNWYAEFIKHAISLTGDYNIQIVGTAEQLMKKLNTQPDIVTLDFNLPDAKGEKILEQIVDYFSLPSIFMKIQIKGAKIIENQGT